jgi:hypothetical protein
MVDQFRSGANQLLACAEQRKVILRFCSAVLNGMQELDIDATLARQEFRIHTVIALTPPPPTVHRARIRNNYLVAQAGELTRDPRRVGPHLEDNTAGNAASEVRCNRFGRCCDGAFAATRSCSVDLVQDAGPISNVEADRNVRHRSVLARHVANLQLGTD